MHLDLQLGGAPLVQADERELREVLTNLVNNALDAMALGGTLGLHTGEVDGRAIWSVPMMALECPHRFGNGI